MRFSKKSAGLSAVQELAGKMPLRKLKAMQQRFVEEYLIDLTGNGTQAAIRAGYAPHSARITASYLLTRPNIQAALAQRQQELRDSAAVTPERVIQEYARLAFADMADYVSWDGLAVRAIDSAKLREGATRAVAEVTETITDKGRTFRFKLHDKKGALDSLAKHLGLFPELTPPPPPAGQQLQPGQREITWRVVYDTPPDTKAAFDLDPDAPVRLPDGGNS